MTGRATVADLQARQTEITLRLRALHDAWAGQHFNDETRAEWNTLNEERDANEATIEEFRIREARVGYLEREQ